MSEFNLCVVLLIDSICISLLSQYSLITSVLPLSRSLTPVFIASVPMYVLCHSGYAM